MAHRGRQGKVPRQKGMMFMEKFNRSIVEACRKKLIEEPKAMAEDSDAQPDPMNVRTMDFDQVHYTLKVPDFSDNPRKLELSMTWDCIPQLIKAGGQAMLDSKYSDYSPNVDGSTVAISVDGASLPADAEEVCQLFGCLKHNLFAAPMEANFDALLAGSKIDPSYCDYRMDGRLYVSPGDDRITITHGIHFDDETDQQLVYVFLQEFVDAQKKSHSPAPICMFHQKPPQEVKDIIDANSEIEPPPKHVETYYISFAVLKTHITPEKREKCSELVLGVRTYLNYHIKCTKAFLHTRMRNKVQELHKVLKAAYPQNVKGQKKKKKKKPEAPKAGTRHGHSIRRHI